MLPFRLTPDSLRLGENRAVKVTPGGAAPPLAALVCLFASHLVSSTRLSFFFPLFVVFFAAPLFRRRRADRHMKTDGCRAAPTKGKAQGTSTLQSLLGSPRAADFFFFLLFFLPSVARLPNVTKNKDTSFLLGIRKRQKESFLSPSVLFAI